MRDLNDRVDGAKMSHINYRKNLLDRNIEEGDDSFIDYSGPMSLEEYNPDQKTAMFALLHYHFRIYYIRGITYSYV